MTNFTITTPSGNVIYDDSSEQDDDDDSKEDNSEDDRAEDVVEAIKVWVPIALTLLLILLVCFVTIRAKAKRRRARESGTSNPMTTVSGGVAMNVNVYRNYGVYVNQMQRQQQQGSTPGGITPQEALQNIPYDAPPPSYEDTMKTSGTINASFSASQESVTIQRQSSDPPPYAPADSQMDSANAESGSGQGSEEAIASSENSLTNQDNEESSDRDRGVSSGNHPISTTSASINNESNAQNANIDPPVNVTIAHSDISLSER